MYVFNHAIESYAVKVVILSVCSPSLSPADAVCPPCGGRGGGESPDVVSPSVGSHLSAYSSLGSTCYSLLSTLSISRLLFSIVCTLSN